MSGVDLVEVKVGTGVCYAHPTERLNGGSTAPAWRNSHGEGEAITIPARWVNSRLEAGKNSSDGKKKERENWE